MTERLQFEQWIPVQIEKVFLFFANPANLPRIMPPSSGVELLEVKLVPPPGIGKVESTITTAAPLAGIGSEIATSFRLPWLPFRGTWIARITEFEWNHHFADEQAKGPFKNFHHHHDFAREERDGITGTLVRDVIDFEVGFGFFGVIAQKLSIVRILRKMFEFRRHAVKDLLLR
jgi:ligand-binding SRPBCC domain-containing protein